MKILIKPKAENDLEEIYFYSIKEFGKKKAEEYLNSIDLAFKKISQNPKIGLTFVKKIRFYKASSHLIFYKKSLTNITILRILHKSMLHENHL